MSAPPDPDRVAFERGRADARAAFERGLAEARAEVAAIARTLAPLGDASRIARLEQLGVHVPAGYARGVLWTPVGAGWRGEVFAGPLAPEGPRYCVLRVECAPALKAAVDALCWALLAVVDPPRTLTEATATRSQEKVWTNAGVLTYREPLSEVTVHLAHAGEAVVRVHCRLGLGADVQAGLAAIRAQHFPDDVAADEMERARVEREGALGCRIVRERGRLALLGEWTDGRRAYHARRRAAKEAASPPAAPTLQVVRGTLRRPLGRDRRLVSACTREGDA